MKYVCVYQPEDDKYNEGFFLFKNSIDEVSEFLEVFKGKEYRAFQIQREIKVDNRNE